MRKATDYRTASAANYKRFCKTHPETDVSSEEWKRVIYSYMDLYREYLLETGQKMKLPCGWGEFAVEKRKKKKVVIRDGKEKINLSVDWAKSRIKHKRIYHMNYHSEGYSFRWKWFREAATYRHNPLWYFKPSRPTSRMIAHYIKVDENYQHKYLQWGQ